MKSIYISHSHLETLAECETKHVLKRAGWTPREESNALKCGSTVHSALEAFRTGYQSQQCLEIFAGEYQAYSEANVPADDARDWRNVSAILAEYMRTRVPGAVPWNEVVHVEKGYGAILCTVGEYQIWYYSRPDAVVRRDGRLGTLDTKTTGWLTKDWPRQWDVAPQITGQAWNLAQVLGEPINDAFIDGIELKVLNSSSKKCAKHGVAYYECAPQHLNFQHVLTQRTQRDVDTWLHEACWLAGAATHLWDQVADGGVRRARQNGIFTGTCTKYAKWCDYYDYCLAGRGDGLLEGLYAVSEWKLDEVVDTPLGPRRFVGGMVEEA